MHIVPWNAAPSTCETGYHLNGTTYRCTKAFGHGGRRHAHGDLEWPESSPNHVPNVDSRPTMDR